MEVCLHAADVSVPCRPQFDIVRKWTYLLFEEFFEQGDAELKQDLSISFLCDRKTTNVAKSQNGFISFIVLPLFQSVSELLPSIECLHETAKANKLKWEGHQETESEKMVYVVAEDPNSELGDSSSDEKGGITEMAELEEDDI